VTGARYVHQLSSSPSDNCRLTSKMNIQAKKMRCTPDHNGCASCISQNLPCRVTDPVTGQTYVRGEAGRMRQVIDRLNEQAETLRREITRLQQENELLQSSHMDLKSQLSLYKSSLNTYDVCRCFCCLYPRWTLAAFFFGFFFESSILLHFLLLTFLF
jgi:hypothetical protein